MQLCAPTGKEARDYEPLFRIEGAADSRKLAVVKTRGNEHHLEKVRLVQNRAQSKPKLITLDHHYS